MRCIMNVTAAAVVVHSAVVVHRCKGLGMLKSKSPLNYLSKDVAFPGKDEMWC